MRKAFNFYRSYYDVFKELSDKDKLAFVKALLDRQFTGKEPDLKGMAKFAYISQKEVIDSQIKGWEDKTGKTLSTPIEGGCATPTEQGEGEEEEKGKEKKFTPPKLDEVKIYFSENGYTEESAIKAFKYYESGDWKDAKGNKVRNWKQKMRGVWFEPKNEKKAETKLVGKYGHKF